MKIKSFFILVVVILRNVKLQLLDFENMDKSDKELFDEFRKKFNKKYNNQKELEFRFQIFLKNMRILKAEPEFKSPDGKILLGSSLGVEKQYQKGINDFIDLTNEEFEEFYLLPKSYLYVKIENNQNKNLIKTNNFQNIDVNLNDNLYQNNGYSGNYQNNYIDNNKKIVGKNNEFDNYNNFGNMNNNIRKVDNNDDFDDYNIAMRANNDNFNDYNSYNNVNNPNKTTQNDEKYNDYNNYNNFKPPQYNYYNNNKKSQSQEYNNNKRREQEKKKEEKEKKKKEQEKKKKENQNKATFGILDRLTKRIDNFRNRRSTGFFGRRLQELHSKSLSNLKRKVDWREKKMISSVKNQSRCNSCYAFSVNSAIEAAEKIKYGGDFINLSEQELLDCSKNYDCRGGQPKVALDYIIENGISFDKQYPYKNKASGRCLRKKNDDFEGRNLKDNNLNEMEGRNLQDWNNSYRYGYVNNYSDNDYFNGGFNNVNRPISYKDLNFNGNGNNEYYTNENNSNNNLNRNFVSNDKINKYKEVFYNFVKKDIPNQEKYVQEDKRDKKFYKKKIKTLTKSKKELISEKKELIDSLKRYKRYKIGSFTSYLYDTFKKEVDDNILVIDNQIDSIDKQMELFLKEQDRFLNSKRKEDLKRQKRKMEEKIRKQKLKEIELKTKKIEEEELRIKKLREENFRIKKIKEQRLRDQKLEEQRLKNQKLEEKRLRDKKLEEQRLRDLKKKENSLKNKKKKKQKKEKKK